MSWLMVLIGWFGRPSPVTRRPSTRAARPALLATFRGCGRRGVHPPPRRSLATRSAPPAVGVRVCPMPRVSSRWGPLMRPTFLGSSVLRLSARAGSDRPAFEVRRVAKIGKERLGRTWLGKPSRALIGLILGVACGFGGLLVYNKIRLRTASDQAEALLAQAARDAEDVRKEAELQAKEEALRRREALDAGGRGRSQRLPGAGEAAGETRRPARPEARPDQQEGTRLRERPALPRRAAGGADPPQPRGPPAPRRPARGPPPDRPAGP